MKKFLLIPCILVFSVRADLPSSHDVSSQKFKRALPLDKSQESSRSVRIQMMKAKLVRSRPELANLISRMDRVLLSPQAMENYLRSLLSSQEEVAKPNPVAEDFHRVVSDDKGAEDTAKVDEEMARLEELKGGDLGVGTDPGQGSQSGELETMGKSSGSLNGDLKSALAVAQSEDAVRGLQILVATFKNSTNAADPHKVYGSLLTPPGVTNQQGFEPTIPGSAEAYRILMEQGIYPKQMGLSTQPDVSNPTSAIMKTNQ